MPSLCTYLNCHNLASPSFGGYCNEEHMKRAEERRRLELLMEKKLELKTIAEARNYVRQKLYSVS
jgi:hypothetical protein